MDPKPLVSREEVLFGLQGRRAMHLLTFVESRTIHLIAQLRRAVEVLLKPEGPHESGGSYLQQVFKLSQEAISQLTLDDLERYAPQWANMIPADPKLQAALGRLLSRKYSFTYEAVPGIRQALGLDRETVQEAYTALYHQPLATIFAAEAGPAAAPAEAGTEVEAKLNPLADVESELEWVYLSKGEILFRQGEAGDSLYVLTHGRLRVLVEQEDGTERVVAELSPGEIVGEMALIADEPRLATVYAIRDTALVKLSKVGFERLMEQRPHVATQIARSIAVRLRQMTLRPQRPAQMLAALAVIPVSPEVPLSDFCVRLVTALSAHGSTLHLTREYLEQNLPQEVRPAPLDEANTGAMVAWLSEQEMKYRFVIYEAEAEPSAWTSRCIRQADHILIVGQVKAEAGPGQIELELLPDGGDRIDVRKSLVLLHPDGSRPPRDTNRWLAVRSVSQHHHLRWDRTADFERLARFMADCPVGLALSGGGARGFAHIGVIRALDEAGIPIDLVGGTSQGALIAAEYALGWNYEAMLAQNKEIFTRIFDFTLPLVSLLTGRKMVKKIQRSFGSIHIEDLWLPYFCISSNLSRAAMIIHRTGPVWMAVRASGSLPGIAPPLFYNGDLLVDGGLLNNLPIDIMRDLCGRGPVIAVDVSPPIDLTQNSPFGASLSGWQILWSRINPFAEKLNLPNIAAILYRAGGLGSTFEQKELIRQQIADLYLRPPVERFDTFDFKNIAKIAELGYHFAREKIAAWQVNDHN